MKMNRKITLEVLDERISNFFRENKEDHETIIVQTTKTNGRVTKLEAWRNLIIGGLTILNVIVWPFVLYCITKKL
jgi:hypothetical protein